MSWHGIALREMLADGLIELADVPLAMAGPVALEHAGDAFPANPGAEAPGWEAVTDRPDHAAPDSLGVAHVTDAVFLECREKPQAMRLAGVLPAEYGGVQIACRGNVSRLSTIVPDHLDLTGNRDVLIERRSAA
jgi:hypothetical protein